MSDQLNRVLDRLKVPSQPVQSASEPVALNGNRNAGAGPETPCSAYRVQTAGGFLMSLAMHPSLTPFEQVYRRLAEDGVFSASPSRPFIVELGSFRVPNQMAMLLMDWRFDIYRQNGAMVGDFVPLEERRLPLSVGWDVRFTAKRQANLRYEITPSPPTAAKEAYAGNVNPGFIPGQGISRASPAEFAQRSFQASQGPSGVGLSLQPQRHRREAQLNMPFTYVVASNQEIQFRAVVLQPIQLPIAFFEAEWSGMLLSSNALEDFLRSVAPCSGNVTGGK